MRNSMSDITRGELERLQIFRSVDIRTLEPLLSDCPIKTFLDGDILISAGHHNEDLYLLLEGCVGVHLSSKEDDPIVVREAGEVVGELSVIDRLPTSAFVVAKTRTRVLVVDNATLWKVAKESRIVFNNLLVTGSTRLRNASQLIDEDRRQLRQQVELLSCERERFKDFAELAADYFWEMDGDLKFTYVSERYQETTGLAPERLLGRTGQEFLTNYIDTPEQWAQHYADLEAHRPFEDFELRWVRSDGKKRVFRNSGKPLFNENGEFQGYRGVVRDVTEAHRMAEQIAHQASHDALTGLVNRQEFEQRLQRVLETAGTERTEHALCYLDLDQFKVINDTCGHAAGDELLRQLGIVLREQVRDRDTLARLGGDEFGALMEHCSLQKAGRVANALRDAIQEFRFVWEGRTFSIGVSIGLVPITGVSKSITAVLREADTACYAAKDSGRNRIHVYHQEDAELTRRHREMQWVARINRALEEDRFKLNVQPIVPVEHDDTTESKGDHYELLLRMKDEEGRSVFPDDFMPAAEHYNLATKIDRWVIHTAFEWFARHPEHLKRLYLCAINFSSHSLGDEEFVGFVIRAFDGSSVPPKKICFEITETAAIANLDAATRCLNALKGLGCRFALDDFGSGVSSFAYLKYLPVDFLKIDGVFVKGVADNPMDLAVVKSINEIAQAMGKRTIAECVETKGILEKLKLRELGVDYAQGYYVGRPRPIEEMT